MTELDRATLARSFDTMYNKAIDHAIQTIQTHIKKPQDAQGFCIDAINYELILITEELQKLKK